MSKPVLNYIKKLGLYTLWIPTVMLWVLFVLAFRGLTLLCRPQSRVLWSWLGVKLEYTEPSEC